MTKSRRDFDITKLTLLLAASLCLVVAGPAQAELTDFTGATYTWVSYNDLTSGPSRGSGLLDLNPGGDRWITDYGYETDGAVGGCGGPYTGANTRLWSQNEPIGGFGDHPGVQCMDLVAYDTGNVTTNWTYTFVNPASENNLWTRGGCPALSDGALLVFGDTGVAHNFQGLWNPDGAVRGCSLLFSGLNDSMTYDFAACASGGGGDMVYSVVVGTGATNDSVASAGYTPGVTSMLGDDLICFTGIAPVSGVIEIQYVSTGTRSTSLDLLPSAFAFGEVIPEPATMSLLAIGGVMALVRRRRK